MFEFVAALMLMWPIHLVCAIPVALPVAIIMRKKGTWRRVNYLAFVLPWTIWLLAFSFGPKYGSLSNALLESICIGAMVGLSFIALLLLQSRFNPRTIRVCILCTLCISAILLRAFIPPLGE